MACVIAPPYEAFMLLKLFAPISPFGLIPVLQRSFATLSMIPRPVLQGVECGRAFAVHSRRQASFRRR
jgi:hypothetical protein